MKLKKKVEKKGVEGIGADRTFDPERGLAGSDRRERVLDLHQLSWRAAAKLTEKTHIKLIEVP